MIRHGYLKPEDSEFLEMSGYDSSAAQVLQKEKDRRTHLPKPRSAEEKRLDKMRSEYRRMGVKPNF